MTTRPTISLSAAATTLLTMATVLVALPAQAGPRVLATGTIPASAFGLAEVHDIEVVARSGGFEVFLAGRSAGSSNLDLVSGRWSPAQNRFIASSHVNGLNSVADESSVTVTEDLLHLIYDTPNGPRIASRATVTAPFGNPRSLGSLPKSPARPAFVRDSFLLLYEDSEDVWVTDIDVNAAQPVWWPGNEVSQDEIVPMTAGITINLPPITIPGGGSLCKTVYTYRKNGNVKKCKNVYREGGSVTVGVATTYATGGEPTGGSMLHGTQFFCHGTDTIQVMHLLTSGSTGIPAKGGGVEMPVFAPVPGMPASSYTATDDLWLVIGLPLASPLPTPFGILGVAPQVVLGPVANRDGYAGFRMQVPAGLPVGFSMGVQALGLSRSGGGAVLGTSGLITIK